MLDVRPRLIHVRGSTRVRLIGFGFVNAGNDLKSLIATNGRGSLKCGGTGSCIQQADFIDKSTIESPTFPQSTVSY